ncbi:MAG: hypothetical protein H7337_24890 [Rhizobacter sp.]|nr:hypothetical protein [Rhizobacter sp.]
MPATHSASDKLSQPVSETPLPWWRFKIVWLVFGLPATVVVASLVTGAIAWTHIDPVVTDARFTHPNAAEEVAEHGQPKSALEPAMTARNHAATPGR